MKFLTCMNLVGVVALVVLCAIQWQVNREYNLRVIALDGTRQQQAAAIADRDTTIAGYKSDLEEFRKRLEKSESALKDLEKKIDGLTEARDKANAERDAAASARDEALADRDALKKSLDSWIAAVKQRDEALKKAGQDAEQWLKGRNDAVTRFNDLATKYNALVKDWNDLQAKLAGKKNGS